MTRIFSRTDQLAFAELSGDYNPIHVDAVAARRFMFGRPVAHGIHVVLWALDQLLTEIEAAQRDSAPGRLKIKTLTASFRSPIIENEPVALSINPTKAAAWRLDISANTVKLVTIIVGFEELVASEKSVAVRPVLPDRKACVDMSSMEIPKAAGQLPLCLEPRLASQLFPAAARLLSADQIALLLATTRLIGMEAPGLHSLFTGLELSLSTSHDSQDLTYRAESFDERFSLLSMAVSGANLAGTVSAARRPAPKAQVDMLQLRQLIQHGEFRGERVLVIGGSRGLGEVAAKELAAGDAEVRFTYRIGAADAQNVVAQIAASGGNASCFAYDVAKDAANLAGLLEGWFPTLLCYFATPFIFSAKAGRFNPILFREFCDCYVDGFLNTFQAVRSLAPNLRGVLYPSSIAVDEIPANMAEYSAAKAAAESLCIFLANQHKEIRFLTPRLPRLPTDQTASLLSVETADLAIVVLDLLRQMRK